MALLLCVALSKWHCRSLSLIPVCLFLFQQGNTSSIKVSWEPPPKPRIQVCNAFWQWRLLCKNTIRLYSRPEVVRCHPESFKAARKSISLGSRVKTPTYSLPPHLARVYPKEIQLPTLTWKQTGLLMNSTYNCHVKANLTLICYNEIHFVSTYL